MGAAIENAGLSVNEKGKVIQSIKNCVTAIMHDESMKDMFRFNEMTDNVEVSGAWWKRSSSSITDNDVNNIRLYLETNYGLSHEKNIPRAIDIVAHQRSYHPVREYLEGLAWDGGKYIENLLPKYLGVSKSDYATQALKLTMLGAIERVYNPGVKFDTMLCIVDDEQGGGKSTIARFLAIKDEWFTDDVKNLDDENVYRKLQGHWIVEFSEMLATANTKTIEAIKSFLSRQKDNYKIPYDRYAHDFPRQCVFIGTTNNFDFLPNDRTGNRRFIPVLANMKAAEVHPLENEAETRAFVVQAWAEAMEIYRNKGYSLVFPEELKGELVEMRRKCEPENPKVGIIQDWLDNCEYDSVCSLMIYREAFENTNHEPKHWELGEISSIMNKSIVGWEKHGTKSGQVRFHKYGIQRAWDKVVDSNLSTDGFTQLSMDDMESDLPFS